MSKYIDADKLIAEIEKRLKNVRDYMNGAGMKYKGPKYFKSQGKESSYDALLSLITSLQQEQPQVADASKMEQEGYLEYWLEHFGMPKENIENCADQIAQGYGAIRYLEGVQDGAEAVNELGLNARKEE